MSDTARLALPLLAAAQAQKHVTHNEALVALDTLVQLSVLDRDLASPPPSPAEGDCHIVATAATGDWTGWENRIARFEDNAWRSFAPGPGWLAYVQDEEALLVFDGADWVEATSSAPQDELQNLALLGIGTIADAANPFSAKLNKALWTAKTVSEGGNGDLRYTLNKESAADVLSLLLQSNWSGRAELGLIGDDDFSLKVSPNGVAWHNALTVDKDDGTVRFLAGEVDVASAATCDVGAAAALACRITGTTTISSLGSVANCIRLLRFAGALTLTHNATTLILPGAANITTAAGDCALATSDASGNWRVRLFQRASGKALIGPASTDISDSTATGRAALTAANAAALATSAGLGSANSPSFAGIAVPSLNGGQHGFRGLLINPDGRVQQRAGGAIADGAYGLHDRWYALSQIGAITPSQLADVASGLPNMMRLTNSLAGNQRLGYAQIVESANCRHLRGRQATLHGTVRRSDSSGTRVAVLEWTDTADAVTRDVVGDWASNTHTPGNFFAAPGILLAGTTAVSPGAATLGTFSITVSISGACNNLIILVWSSGAVTASTGTLDLAVQLVPGSLADAFMEVRPLAIEEDLCRRYFDTKSVQSQNGARHIPLAPKRIAPTVMVGVGSAGSITRDGFELTHSAAASCAVTADAEL